MNAVAGRRWALIVGHPGHELRVWGWMRASRPVVAILTDGSAARFESASGAEQGSVPSCVRVHQRPFPGIKQGHLIRGQVLADLIQ